MPAEGEWAWWASPFMPQLGDESGGPSSLPCPRDFPVEPQFPHLPGRHDRCSAACWGIWSFSRPLPCGAGRKQGAQSASSFSRYPLALCQAGDAVRTVGSLLWLQSILPQSGPGDGDKRKRE